MKNGITRNDLNIGIRHENVISVQVTNEKITKENIEELEEAVEFLHNNYEHINIILLLSGTLELTLSANIEALRMYFKTKDIIKKIAVVSDKKWIEFGTKLENMVTPWEEKYFPSTELDDAWEWVKSTKLLEGKIRRNEKKVTIADLHFEHVSWSKEFHFQKDELKVFQKRLEEVVTAHQYVKDVLKRVEYFQNQFIRHNEVLDTLLHLINTHEDSIARYDQAHHFEVDDKAFMDHKDLREKAETQQHLYKDLKQEYMKFLTKL